MHPTWLAPLLQSDAEIFERCVIDVESASIRRKYTDVLRRQIQNLSKLYFLFADFFFRNFALFDFYSRPVPFDNLSRFVAQWFFTMKEPAIFPISPPHARLGHVTFPGFKRGAPLGNQFFYLFRMDRGGPSRAEQICVRETEVFQPAQVNEIEVSIRQIRVNKCRSCIYQIAIFLLTIAQLFLRALAVSDVDHGTHEFDEITCRAENRMTSG